MAKIRILPPGVTFDDIETDYGFSKPTNLSGVITSVTFFEAKSGSGRYCTISIDDKCQFKVKASEAIAVGLTEHTKRDEYFLEPGFGLNIIKYFG